MKTYIVTRLADSAEVYRYQADEPIEWEGMEFATHSHIEAPAEPEVEVPKTSRRMTCLAFRQRFTRTEKIRIEMAALDSPTSPMEQRLLAAALRADLADQAQAAFIDPDRPDTRQGVMNVEAAGLLDAPGRALEILDAPVTEQEAFNG